MSVQTAPLFDVDAESDTLTEPTLEAIREAEAEAEREEAKAVEKRRVRRLLRDAADEYRTYETLRAV